MESMMPDWQVVVSERWAARAVCAAATAAALPPVVLSASLRPVRPRCRPLLQTGPVSAVWRAPPLLGCMDEKLCGGTPLKLGCTDAPCVDRSDSSGCCGLECWAATVDAAAVAAV